MTDKKDDEVIKFTQEESKRIGSDIITEMLNNPIETGTSLLHLATRRESKVFMENVINRVQELVSHRNQLYIAKEKTERRLRYLINEFLPLNPENLLLASMADCGIMISC